MEKAMRNTPIGLRNIGVYYPDTIVTSKEIAELSSIPEAVIREKFGIESKRKAAPGENVSDMCVKAARSCIQGILEPEELDLIIYHGSEYRDYYLYNCSAQIQHKLGAKNAKIFELHNLCSSGPLAMQLAESVMFVHPEISLLPSRSGMTRSMTISTLPIPEITGFRCSPPRRDLDYELRLLRPPAADGCHYYQ